MKKTEQIYYLIKKFKENIDVISRYEDPEIDYDQLFSETIAIMKELEHLGVSVTKII